MLKIEGTSFEIFALSPHVEKTIAPSGEVITRRTLPAEQMYRYRYQGDISLLRVITSRFMLAVKTLCVENATRFDGVVVVPPPMARKDFGPVLSFAKDISRLTAIPLLQFAVKDCTPATDGVQKPKRMFAFSSPEASKVFIGKRILVIDDIYRSGRSLGSFCRLLVDEGGALGVTVLVGSAVDAPV